MDRGFARGIRRWKAGVVIAVRGDHVGLSFPPSSLAEVLPGRAAIGIIEARGYPTFVGVSIYLVHGNGLGDENACKTRRWH